MIGGTEPWGFAQGPRHPFAGAVRSARHRGGLARPRGLRSRCSGQAALERRNCALKLDLRGAVGEVLLVLRQFLVQEADIVGPLPLGRRASQRGRGRE